MHCVSFIVCVVHYVRHALGWVGLGGLPWIPCALSGSGHRQTKKIIIPKKA